jgi:diacylglycerol kinase family enzyme
MIRELWRSAQAAFNLLSSKVSPIGRPVLLQVDGEPVGALPASVTLMPGAIQLLRT